MKIYKIKYPRTLQAVLGLRVLEASYVEFISEGSIKIHLNNDNFLWIGDKFFDSLIRDKTIEECSDIPH